LDETQFNRRERDVAKEELKAPGTGYYSVLDNAEAHDGYRMLRGGNRDMLQPSEKAAVEKEKKNIPEILFLFFFIC
jgi:hypothetical protein